MERHRIAGHGLMFDTPCVGPRNRHFDFVVACGYAHFDREPTYRLSRDAGDFGRPFRRAMFDLFFEQLQRRLHRGAVGQGIAAAQDRVGAGRMRLDGAVAMAVPPHLVLRIQRIDDRAVFVMHEQAEPVALGVDIDQLAGIRIAGDERAIVQPLRHQHMDDRHEQRTVGAGAYRDPFVGNRGITGAYRVDRNKSAACAFEFGYRDF